ncbi:hypothetical protein DNTS_003853 [Danionella cerebrum]|uniref:Aquaporin n=1 Tax=Danionella cerebrum TaxID=2873325 RepID=A0A553QYV5_9TELE|nr:hypothetical protein DNTS_003853 [Danionella translucida]
MKEMKQEVSMVEDVSIQGHVAPTVLSMLKIKNECVRVVLAESFCTFIMMVSGAHMNAAVSVTMCVFGNLPWKMLPLYILAQFLGSFLAAGTVFALYYELVVGTGMLMLCLMALSDQRNQPSMSGAEPVGVGLLVMLIGISLGSNSGYAINPTRDLAPRVFTLLAGWGREVFRAGNSWWWVPCIAPIIGGVLGALLYKALVELHHPQLKKTTAAPQDPELIPLEKCKNGTLELSV